MKINSLFGLSLVFVFLSSCSDTPPAERVDETLSAPVYTGFNIGDYNKCFSTSSCTDIKKEELEEKLDGKYIILDGLIDEVKGWDDPNTFSIKSCVSYAGSCPGYAELGRLKQMNGGEFPFKCAFDARTYTKTDAQSNYIRNLGPGNYVKVKGEVGFISGWPSCKITLYNAVVIK